MTTETAIEKPVLTPCLSCGVHKHVSPMVVFWLGDPTAPCIECGGVGEVPVCSTCRGEGTRDPDPGEPAPQLGKHRCRRCQGWGTIGNPPTTADELGVPTDLRWLVEKNPTGRAVITHFLSLPMAERLYLMARAVRMQLAVPVLADLITPGWEHHEQVEDQRASHAVIAPAAPMPRPTRSRARRVFDAVVGAWVG